MKKKKMMKKNRRAGVREQEIRHGVEKLERVLERGKVELMGPGLVRRW